MNVLVTERRNACLAFFEFCACFLIVFIHCRFPGDFGMAVKSIARVGVPLFFGISGYYLCSENDDITVKKIKE